MTVEAGQVWKLVGTGPFTDDEYTMLVFEDAGCLCAITFEGGLRSGEMWRETLDNQESWELFESVEENTLEGVRKDSEAG